MNAALTFIVITIAVIGVAALIAAHKFYLIRRR